MTTRRKKTKAAGPAVIGERLRELREKKGWRQFDLCARADLHPNELSSYELGHKDMMAATLLRLCRALEANPSYLVGLTDKPGK